MNDLLQAVAAVPNNMHFYMTMFPQLDASIVEEVLLTYKDHDEIISALNKIKFGSIPEDELRACAVSTAEIRESPELWIEKVPGDGKCLFHAIHKALQMIEGGDDDYGMTTDQLRTFVFNRMNDPEFRLLTMAMLEFENAGTNQTGEQLFLAYMQSMRAGRQWAGDVELNILADLLQREIQVWVTFNEYAKHTWGQDPTYRRIRQVSTEADYVLLSESNCSFPLKPHPDDKKAIEEQKKMLAEKEPLRLLYSGRVHYDALVKAKK